MFLIKFYIENSDIFIYPKAIGTKENDYMLDTPIGIVHVFINDIETAYSFMPLPIMKHRYPDVNGRYKIIVNGYTETSTIRCIIPTYTETAYPESGENLEAVAFYQNGSKLTLGIQADFEKQCGKLLSNGLEITTNEPVKFSICWINNVTEENDHQTWFGVDLNINE